jgi:hypothetical protein
VIAAKQQIGDWLVLSAWTITQVAKLKKNRPELPDLCFCVDVGWCGSTVDGFRRKCSVWPGEAGFMGMCGCACSLRLAKRVVKKR